MRTKIILIAGGSGLIGQEVQKEFLKKGHEVRVLTRNKNPKYPYFYWLPEEEKVEEKALEKVQVIINLAGKGIANKRWTKKERNAIYNSRIKTTQFLHRLSFKMPYLQQYVSASGITCYGFDHPLKIYKEDSPFGKDFPSVLVKRWEEAADLFSPNQKVVKVRTGVVLSKHGGILARISNTLKYHIGAPLGSGEQYVPWITLKDIARVYLHVIEEELEGVYHASAGNITNSSLTKRIAQKNNIKFWFPYVPSFFIRLLFGEMSTVVLHGVKVDNSLLKETGFSFTHKSIEDGLEYIYARNERGGNRK